LDPSAPESTQRDKTAVVLADFNDGREYLTGRLWCIPLRILVEILDIVAVYLLSKNVLVKGFFYSLNDCARRRAVGRRGFCERKRRDAQDASEWNTLLRGS